MRIQRRPRPAFTLVELMVAIALTLFLMAIIAEAFGSATKTFSTMRTAGQLQERIRGGAIIMRLDLAAEHFDGPYIGGRGGPRVGDQRLDLAGWVPPQKGCFEIRQFNAGMPSVPEPQQYFLNTGTALTDGEGLPSSRADSHILRFTVKLPDLPATELYSAELPTTANVFVNGLPMVWPLANDPKINAFPTGQPITYSRWAEIQYFLKPSVGDSTPATANGPSLPLYSLRRRVRVLAPAGVTLPPMLPADAALLIAKYPDVAMARIAPGPNGTVILRVLGADDVGNPGVTAMGDPIRMPYQAYSQKLNAANIPYETGDDVLITDVLSFEVKAAWFNNQSTPSFNAIMPGSSPAVRPMFVNGPPVVTVNTEEPFDDIPQGVVSAVPPPVLPQPLNPSYAGQRVFDTWFLAPGSDSIDWDKPQPTLGGQNGFLSSSNANPPLRINVRALQIKIRVWDAKAETARQVTIIQEI